MVNQFFFESALVIKGKESKQSIWDALTVLNPEDDDEYYIAFHYVVDG